jgi:hypothetical protein
LVDAGVQNLESERFSRVVKQKRIEAIRKRWRCAREAKRNEQDKVEDEKEGGESIH